MSTRDSAKHLNNQDRHYNNLADQTEQKLQQAIEFHGKEQFSEAATLYQEVLALVPDNPFANFNLATILHGSGELPKAIGCYKKVITIEPDNFQVLQNLADAYRDQGFLEQAAITYQRALEVSSEHPDINYNLGVIYHQLGYLEQSLESFANTLTFAPDHFATLYNMGAICLECDAYSKALDFYSRASALEPDDMDCCYNLALTYAHLNRYEEAASHYRRVLSSTPEDAALHNTLGTVYRQLKDYEQAAKCHKKALELQPDLGSTCTNLAITMQMLGDTESAVKYFQQAVELDYDVESAKHMIAALKGESRDSTPQDYISNLFDSYANNFDKSLVNGLDYDVPAKLYALHESLELASSRYEQVIDLGCGTGLAAEQFRNFADSLTGVDLSKKMLVQAKGKKIYDRLHCEDFTQFLNNSTVLYDLVLAADVLGYIGDLKPMFTAIAARTAKNALFLFSVEEHDGQDYLLRHSGRFAYSQKYVKNVASQNGFVVESIWSTKLRKEKGEWIGGCLFAMRKDG